MVNAGSIGLDPLNMQDLCAPTALATRGLQEVLCVTEREAKAADHY